MLEIGNPPGSVSMAARVLPSTLPTDERYVRLANPLTHHAESHHMLLVNDSVRVEYLPGGRRAPVTEELHGSAAVCVQALRDAYEAPCWEALD